VPIVRIQTTITIDTDEVGIVLPEEADELTGPSEEDVEDVVYAYFQQHADELADLIKQECDDKKNYQDTVEVEFEEWG